MKGGPNRGQGRKPKPPYEKGTLLKSYPPFWLYVLVQSKAKETGKSQSQIIIDALQLYFNEHQ